MACSSLWPTPSGKQGNCHQQGLYVGPLLPTAGMSAGVVATAIEALSQHPSWATICQGLDHAELQVADGSSSVASVVGQLAERLVYPDVCEIIQHFVDLIQVSFDVRLLAQSLHGSSCITGQQVALGCAMFIFTLCVYPQCKCTKHTGVADAS